MKRKLAPCAQEILIFDATCPERARLNVLKEFISYLKFSGMRSKIDFSFSGHEESAHAALTIKENYMLDSVPTSLIKDREDNFQTTAENLANEHLKKLIEATQCVDRLMSELSVEDKKLVSIVKALLSQSEYLFMDKPDMYLSAELLEKVKLALLFEAKENNRKILIRPAQREKWLDLATHIVAKDDLNRFNSAPNPLCETQHDRVKHIPRASVYQFELIKKAG